MIIAPKLEPIILDSNIDIIEDGVDVYDASSTYSTGDVVQINDNINRKYKATQDVPEGVTPINDVNATTGVGTYWLDYGATNYKKAFDELASSSCLNSDTIYYKFQTSDVDLLMLGGLSAITVRVKVVNTDTDTVLLDETYATTTREVYDWHDYTYAQAEKQTSFFMLLPMAYNTTLELWINTPDEIVSVGHVAFGRSKNVGLSLMDPKPTSSRRGLTTKSRDEFGNIITRKKARYKTMTISCLIDSTVIDIIEDRLDSFVDKACIFVGDERDGGYKALLIFGELKDHDMPIGLVKTTYQLEVDGYI